ncbi:hypothetical protein SUGI_0190560 [Cryptomeria japonica]|nr:hypothetical protein SUGI_0190560 [Cryptomeria japonica]
MSGGVLMVGNKCTENVYAYCARLVHETHETFYSFSIVKRAFDFIHIAFPSANFIQLVMADPSQGCGVRVMIWRRNWSWQTQVNTVG